SQKPHFMMPVSSRTANRFSPYCRSRVCTTTVFRVTRKDYAKFQYNFLVIRKYCKFQIRETKR
ncbi:MAG: hypothetical protein ACTSPW_20900, partial [Promethearchaeota archaeon]